MSRKSVILSSVVLVLLCAVMALIPTLVNSISGANGSGGSALDPRRAASELLGTDAGAPPTLAEWIRDRTEDDPTQLKIVATADPEMSIEERVRLLEEAEQNQPEVPQAGDPEKARRSRKKTPGQPPEVLPADEPNPG